MKNLILLSPVLLSLSANAESLWIIQRPANPSTDINVFSKQLLMENAAFLYKKVRENNIVLDRPIKKVENISSTVNHAITSTVDGIMPSAGQVPESKFKFKVWVKLETATVFTETLLSIPKINTTSNFIVNSNNIKLNIYDNLFFDVNSTLQFHEPYYGLAYSKGWD